MRADLGHSRVLALWHPVEVVLPQFVLVAVADEVGHEGGGFLDLPVANGHGYWPQGKVPTTENNRRTILFFWGGVVKLP